MNRYQAKAQEITDEILAAGNGELYIHLVSQKIATALLDAENLGLEKAAKVASEMENEFWDDGQYQTTDSGNKIAGAIRALKGAGNEA